MRPTPGGRPCPRKTGARPTRTSARIMTRDTRMDKRIAAHFSFRGAAVITKEAGGGGPARCGWGPACGPRTSAPPKSRAGSWWRGRPKLSRSICATAASAPTATPASFSARSSTMSSSPGCRRPTGRAASTDEQRLVAIAFAQEATLARGTKAEPDPERTRRRCGRGLLRRQLRPREGASGRTSVRAGGLAARLRGRVLQARRGGQAHLPPSHPRCAAREREVARWLPASASTSS